MNQSQAIDLVLQTLRLLGDNPEGALDDFRTQMLRSQLECLDGNQLVNLIKKLSEITESLSGSLSAIDRQYEWGVNAVIEKREKAALAIESSLCGVF